MIKLFESLKFISRFLKSLLYLLCIDFPLQAYFAVVLLPYLYFTRNNDQPMKLPIWLRWTDNADIYPEFKRDSTTYQIIWRSTWWARYCWLAWRNPLNYFTYKYNSIKINPVVSWLQRPSWVPIGDGYNQYPGFKFIEMKQNNKVYYEYYYIHKWNDHTCFRFRMGWKLKDDKIKAGDYVQSVFVISPWHSYSGV